MGGLADNDGGYAEVGCRLSQRARQTAVEGEFGPLGVAGRRSSVRLALKVSAPAVVLLVAAVVVFE